MISEDATYANVTLSNHATLQVTAGALSAETTFYAGYAQGDDGNAVLVDGSTAALALTGTPYTFHLGNLGNDNTLTVKGGATLTAVATSTKNVFALGQGNTRDLTQGCRNVLAVTGPGTSASLYRLTIGTSGCDNKVLVADGASLAIANAVGMSGVDRTGTGNELVISNATATVASSGSLAAANADGGLVVTGSSAEMTVAGTMTIARKAHVKVQDHATLVLTGKTMFGADKGSETSLFVQDGAVLDALGELYLGNVLTNAYTEVSGGAHLYATNTAKCSWVGYAAGADRNELRVTGAGSLAKFNQLKIGDGGSSNIVAVANGATLEVNELYNGYLATACGNRFEVLDGASATVTTYNKASNGSTNNVIRVKDGMLTMNGFIWSHGLTVRLEGTQSHVTWPLNARSGGSPLSGGTLEFVPPAEVRTFAEPVVNLTSSRTSFVFELAAGRGVRLRVADAEACMTNGGGTYPLLMSPTGITGGIENVTVEGPEGTEFFITGDSGGPQTLWVKVPRKSSGMILIVR